MGLFLKKTQTNQIRILEMVPEEAKRTRAADGELYSPYLDFVGAVLEQMGINYSRGSISRSLSNRGQPRRR